MIQAQTQIRPLNAAEDMPAVKRIWREVGWLKESGEKYLDDFFAGGDVLVATMDGTPECCVHTTHGTLCLQNTELTLCAVTAVTTSRVARGHAFAKRLTALQLQQAAENGAAVAALGMFDQGFYDLLGFGTAAYDHEFVFDPATLLVDVCRATPRRLSLDDYEEMHGCLVKRCKNHGAVVLHAPRLLRAEFAWVEGGFGLGFGTSPLTHFIWLEPKGERGPYAVRFIAYQNSNQLLELLGLVKSLADQVYSLRMIEPPQIQLQALLKRPFRHQAISGKSQHEAAHQAFAWWQLRILDLPVCVAAYCGTGEPVRFNLTVTDPLQDMLPPEDAWRGVAGEYIVTLGPSSHAELGHEAGLPQMRCSINAFSRLLWGVASASGLAVTDELTAPQSLLTELDRVIHLPAPHTGWDF